MDKYLNMPVNKYLDDLAAKLPAPGGGSASALAGAAGAALFCMVANFTAGNEKYGDVQEEIIGILKKLETIKKRLAELVDEDVLLYSEVSKAYKFAKNTEEEKKARSEAIQEAVKNALQVPIEILTNCAKAMSVAERLLEIGNKNLSSDIGVGVRLLEAGFDGAVINVDINIALIKDEKYIEKKRNEVNELKIQTDGISERIMKKMVF
jgi:formiminotetrahydrofolate cyclodeaminase